MAWIKKKSDSYLIGVTLGADYNGNKIRRYMTWTPPTKMTPKREEKEVNRVAAEFEAKCRSGLIVDDMIKFSDFAERWFRDYAEKQLKPKTLQRYKQIMPRVNQAIGHIKLRDLRPHHLIEFYNNLGEDGVRLDGKYISFVDLNELLKDNKIKKSDLAKKAGMSESTLRLACKGDKVSAETAEKISNALGVPLNELFEPAEQRKKLSNSTILTHHRVISSILSTAEEWETISSNPCRKVKPPKVTRTAPKYLDVDGAKQLLAALENEEPKYKMITMLLLLTGMRRGEAMGLEWKDIDFENAVIHIVRTSQYIPKQGIITTDTKNQSSNRAIKASPSLIAELRRYRTWQAAERLRVGDQWKEYDRLFTQWNGKPMDPSAYNTWFKGFVKRAELPEITPHSLRHTNATLQIANNVPLTTVAGRLGHATPATTTKIYSHEIKSADAAAAEMLDDLLAPKRKAK